MANVNNKHGLRPLMRTLGGGVPVAQLMLKAVGEAAGIFIWDAVNRLADGSIEQDSATPGTTLYSGVNLGPFGAALTATSHLIQISPDAVFEAQDDNDTDGIAAADLGLNINLNLSQPAITNPATAGFLGVSGHQLDEASAAVGAGLDMHMMALLNVPDNAHGANARIEVVFNKHRMAPAAVGV